MEGLEGLDSAASLVAESSSDEASAGEQELQALEQMGGHTQAGSQHFPLSWNIRRALRSRRR